MEKVSPQASKPEEKKGKAPKQIIDFTRKNLLTASWGSGKGADLLYHLLFRASREVENKKLSEDLKDIKFHEATPKALEMSGLSQGCFHTYLKLFVAVGYVSTKAYSGDYVVHKEAIQQAFSSPPEKPVSETGKPRQPREKSFNLKDCNFVTLSKEDYDLLLGMKDECFKLKEMFQSLKLEHAQMFHDLKEMFQSVKQNATNYASQEASSQDFLGPSNAFGDSNREKVILSDCVDTSSPMFALDPLAEDLPEAQPLLVFSQQANFAYSQEPQATTQEALFPEASGYVKNDESPVQDEKTKLTSEQTEQTRRWYTHFEKVRGEPFETKGDKINARKYIKMLVLKYDETTIMRIYKHLSEKDFKWSKPSFKFKITPYVVYDEAPSVLQQFANPEQAASSQPQKSKISPTSTPEVQQQWQETVKRSLANTDQRLAEYLARKQAQQVAN